MDRWQNSWQVWGRATSFDRLEKDSSFDDPESARKQAHRLYDVKNYEEVLVVECKISYQLGRGQ